MKEDLKARAIELRKKGLTYSEILSDIPVAKSTLSQWLRSVGLAKKQQQRITAKRRAGQKRAAQARRKQRLDLIQSISKQAKIDLPLILRDNLWLIGVVLYWAEGTKIKNGGSQGVTFNNSDVRMIKLFRKWIIEAMEVPVEQIGYELYIHRTADIQSAKIFWAKALICDESQFKVYFKQHKIIKNYRKNIGGDYHGLMRIAVKKSSILNRKISAWVEEVCRHCGVV